MYCVVCCAIDIFCNAMDCGFWWLIVKNKYTPAQTFTAAGNTADAEKRVLKRVGGTNKEYGVRTQ
jgi:hypothetical protein